MRIFTKLLLGLLALTIVVFNTGCGDDGPGLPGGVTLDPTITLNTGADLVSFDQDRDLSDPTFTVSVDVNDGDNPLQSLSIRENGSLIPASQLSFQSGEISNNPFLITGDATDGEVYVIDITPSNTDEGEVEFEFRITDTEQNSSTTTLRINYIQAGPSVEFQIGNGLISSNDTVRTRNTSFDVRLLLAGPNAATNLGSITVFEDGEVLPASQVLFDGSNNGNPIGLSSSNTTTLPLTITANDAAGQTREYTFRVTDANGGETERTITIFFDTPPGTALEFDTTGVFFNASGMQNGGLDLDNARAVSFNSPNAELQDEGINLNLVGENWRHQISAGAAGVVVRTADLSQIGDGTGFDDIETVEEIETLFDGGSALDGDDNFPAVPGDPTSNELVSQPINGADANSEGEIFAVRRGNRTYLVRFDERNFVAGSNGDNYRVSIKY